MKLEIRLQEHNSRGQLLLRTFLGVFYIIIPHGFCLIFLSIVSVILSFVTWWAILFTAKFPRDFFNFQLKLNRWNLRLSARLLNLVDGYPAFGLDAIDDATTLELPYVETYSRGQLLLITFFGMFMIIPHIFLLFFTAIGAMFVNFIAWWVVLFTGKYPASMHDYMVRYIRWVYRLNFYLSFMIHSYPPFNGRPDMAAVIAGQFNA